MPKHFVLSVLLLAISLSIAGACRQAQEIPPPQYSLDATVKDIMDSMIDPSADVVWESVATVVTAEGTEVRMPKTDEDWAKIRQATIRIVEATNLLMMPGRKVAHPHERSIVPGVELEPEEMEALINKDPLAWRKRATRLHDVAMEALKTIDARQAQPLDEIGERLDAACENCHVQYWYPNQVLPPGYEEPKVSPAAAPEPAKP